MAQVACTVYGENFSRALPFSNNNLNVLLANGTALSWTIPGLSTQKFRVFFRCSYTAEIWVSYNGTATDPTSNTATNNPYQEMVPLEECRFVKGGDTLSFLAIAGTPRLSAMLLLCEQ